MLKGVPLLFLSLLAIRGGLSQDDAWTCRKDYSRPCAEGWHQVNASQECVAPLSYRGPCPRFLQMENKTAQKRLLEGECRIFWPCLDRCERNYSLQCPEQWAPEDEKTCRPLAIYEGACLPSHDFSNMTDAQKEIWSNKCGTDWPCMASCKKDYSRGCPQGWTKEKDGSCYAPGKYSGPCLSRMSLLNVDEDMKVALEKLCNVSFPCVETCDVDMSDPCPTGWFVKSDAFGNALSCLPPDNYTGPCGEETKLMGLTNLKSKERMAYECGVRWPCAPAANPINYLQFCPDGWTKSEQYCVAPPNYAGPCARKKLFASFERGMKRAYAEECDVEWPLLGREASDSYPKGSALRKRKYNIGPVEPFTGAIISGTVK